VVRQEVLVAVDADEVLEREGHSRLLVGLELRKIDDEVRRQNRLREEILVSASRVVLGGGARIVIRAAKASGIETRARECTPLTQVQQAVAPGIPL
jgi:hypothetical protein